LQEASPQNILIKRRKYKGRGGAKNLTPLLSNIKTYTYKVTILVAKSKIVVSSFDPACSYHIKLLSNEKIIVSATKITLC
jgi:hypothetical protein